ncbi:hypothetical protein [Streptomyces sp. HD]|uniref:hypothetical protein n=1 Tax=Streptomyces sp. HD TaxID=3020892 RepID=UPI003FA68C05
MRVDGAPGLQAGEDVSYRDVASALVFLVRERPGGYTLGATLAAAHVIGEIAGAPVLGMRLAPARGRRHLAVGLAGGAVGFMGLGVLAGAHPVLLTALGWWGEARRDGPRRGWARQDDARLERSSAAGDLDVDVAAGAEGAPIAGGGDAEGRL